MKRDDHGHIIPNDEQDGQECQHDSGKNKEDLLRKRVEASIRGDDTTEIDKEISSGRDKTLNDMIASLDNARSIDEAWDIEQGIIQREDELKREKDSNSNLDYVDLVQFSARNTNPQDYEMAKEFIVNKGGRYLSQELSKPDSELSEQGKQVRKSIINASKPSRWDFKTYRTDDTHWLEGAEVGSLRPMNVFMNTSLNKDLVIPENKNNVKQKIVFNVKKGDPILTVNNANEEEVEIVKTKPMMGVKVVGITEEDGIPVYELEMVR